ncbi:MAG: pyrimidine 5'-nucleotidase [Alphaproteobacteria bacterium]|nr:MAG: pyrimidine 5'-nucleotidase [Alphaproteobacteria bacterium]
MFHPLDAASVWVFDLDHTLYAPDCDVFARIDARMTAFIAAHLRLPPEAARALQKRYVQSHGTTLRGLMDVHGMAPHAFLDYVHDIALDTLGPDPQLARQLAALPGRKIIYTNGTARHGERVLARLGIGDQFADIYDIAAADYVPKPAPAALAALVARMGLVPARVAMIDDMARNLRPAHALGMTTVWIDNGSEQGATGAAAGHIHHAAKDVKAALAALVDRKGAPAMVPACAP